MAARLATLRRHLCCAPSPSSDSANKATSTLQPLDTQRRHWRRQICCEARRLQLEPIFRYDPVLDENVFRCDGVWVLPGVFTEAATSRLIQACENIQRYNDAWVNCDWRAPSRLTAWAAAGLRPPSQGLAPAAVRAAMTGGTQLGARDSKDGTSVYNSAHTSIFEGSDFVGLRTDKRAPFLHGFCPESFVPGYDPFMLNVLTHPQMLALQTQMLGSDIRLDHNTCMNRKEGFPGQDWHTHAYSEDGLGPTNRAPTLGLVRNLLYPGGFERDGDGGLSVIRGGHLYRDHKMKAANDAELKSTWLKGKCHPITGEPLTIEKLALPRGSLVACLSHAPHRVDARGQHRGMRHNVLVAYANPDPMRKLPRSVERRPVRDDIHIQAHLPTLTCMQLTGV